MLYETTCCSTITQDSSLIQGLQINTLWNVIQKCLLYTLTVFSPQVLKVALQTLEQKFYKNTKKSSLYSQSLLSFIHKTPVVECHQTTREIRKLLWPRSTLMGNTVFLAHLSTTWSYCDRSSSVVRPSICPSVNNFFKNLLLQNQKANLDKTWQECSLGEALQKLLKEFNSNKNSGCHGNKMAENGKNL